LTITRRPGGIQIVARAVHRLIENGGKSFGGYAIEIQFVDRIVRTGKTMGKLKLTTAGSSADVQNA
jgi:hypothetical protein